MNGAGELRLASLLLKSGALGVPVSLFRLATACRVISVSARNMIPRGGLQPTREGFRVFIRSTEFRGELDASMESRLPHYERFSFAHELAHTLYYEWILGGPRPAKTAPVGRRLEDACDVAAARMLVPTEILEAKIARNAEISTDDIVQWADDFRVAPDTIVRRLSSVDTHKTNRAILLIKQSGAHSGEVKAAWYGSEMFSLTSALRPHQRLDDSDSIWNVGLRAGVGESWRVARFGRTIVCKKVRSEALRPGRFFIEATVD